MELDSFYWGIVFLTFIYCIFKVWKNPFLICIVLFFYEGMFAHFGQTIWNSYKITLPIFMIFCFFKYNVYLRPKKKYNYYVIFFVFFSVSFFISSLINSDYLNLILNQYSKYLIFFLSFFIVLSQADHSNIFFYRTNKLLILLLSIQILLSVLNFIFFGVHESIVGSISSNGGSSATILPILGFILLWQIHRGDLKRKQWFFILLLFFISFVSMKRAIWFIMPIIIFLFMQYIPKKKLSKKYLVALPLIPLIFYLGVRLNPTLNKESSLWGTFDFKYVINYTKKYTFGAEENGEKASGRGGATFLVFKDLKEFKIDKKTLFGNGLAPMYTTDYEEFSSNDFGITDKGAASGIFQSYIVSGYIGVFTTLLYYLSILLYIKDKRMRYVMIAIFCWEYFFYASALIRTPVLSFMFAYLIIFSNQPQLSVLKKVVPPNNYFPEKASLTEI